MLEMQRSAFAHDSLTLSFLDAGGDDRPLVALHAHWMEAATFIPLHDALPARWRLIALDQRGHGFSDHASLKRPTVDIGSGSHHTGRGMPANPGCIP